MGRDNMTPEQLFALFGELQKNGKPEQQLRSELSRAILDNMSPEQNAKFDALLRDKDAMERLMQSDQAKQLMKRFGMNNKGR